MDKEQSVQTAASTTQPVVSIQPASIEAKKTSKKTIFIVLGSVLLLCIICSGICVGGGYFALVSSVEVIKTEVSNKVCLTNSSDIEKVYNENTTPNLKAKYSEAEFAAEIMKISSKGCSDLKNANLMDFIGKSWALNTEIKNGESVITFSGKLDTMEVKIVLVGDSNYKIDDIAVTQ